jgi:8-oxo-dGTP diphosphatase
MSHDTKPFPWHYCPVCGAALAREHDGEKERPHCAPCKRYFYRNPLPAVCCLLERSGEILLVRRAIEPCLGEWSLPGGFVEIDETTEEAAVREMHEETGLCVKGLRLIGVSTQRSLHYGAVMVLGYAAGEWSGDLRAGSDALDVGFFPRDKRPTLPFTAHIELLRLYDAWPGSQGVHDTSR